MTLDNMSVGGFVPLTTIDYPEHLSAVLFCQGCPWRCRYCHNYDLLSCKEKSPYAWNDIITFLKKRQKLLEAVVFSGGEPTLQPGVKEAVSEVKEMGFLIGLHTGGMFPKKLKEILSNVDWVGLDIKTMPEKYSNITTVPKSGNNIWESLDLLLETKTKFECRTTYHNDLIDLDTIFQLGECLAKKGVTNYAIQTCRTENVLDSNLSNNYISKETRDKISNKFNKMFSSFSFRE